MKIKHKGPSRNPQHVSEGIWYYEERGCIEIYMSNHIAQGLVCKIPKRMLKASLTRMVKP